MQCSVSDSWLGNKTAAGNPVSLADMTSKAIDMLQANPKSDKQGFLLQVEGASIDKQDHAANACGQIGETDDLGKAISAALDRVDRLIWPGPAPATVETSGKTAFENVFQNGMSIAEALKTAQNQMDTDMKSPNFKSMESKYAYYDEHK